MCQQHMGAISNIIERNIDSFAKQDSDLARTETVKMKIDTKKNNPL